MHCHTVRLKGGSFHGNGGKGDHEDQSGVVGATQISPKLTVKVDQVREIPCLEKRSSLLAP